MSAPKIWVDDLREPPDSSWLWFKDSHEALTWMESRRASGCNMGTVMSLDHDLGGDQTTRPLVLWMCENDVWPEEVRVHSMNPVGRLWLEEMVKRYAPR